MLVLPVWFIPIACIPNCHEYLFTKEKNVRMMIDLVLCKGCPLGLSQADRVKWSIVDMSLIIDRRQQR